MTVLQSRLSGMFFKGFGLWVSQANEAIQFCDRKYARQFIQTERVSDVVVRDLFDATASLGNSLPGE